MYRDSIILQGSIPVYICFILWDGGGSVGYFGGWSFLAWIVTVLGAAGGLLVALSIKYGDAILKTLATTAAIILSSLLDYYFLSGPLTPIMVIAGVQVIIAICNYTFDTTPEPKNTNNNSNNNTVKDSEKDVELATSTNADADK
jgi:solute carrier family 35 (UDP-sugar transporter), member A1/2/3